MKLFVVSGYRRTGTSMMLQALHAGLSTPHIVMSWGSMDGWVLPDKSGYSPNPRGLQEVGQLFYMQVENLRAFPATGTALIKILFDGLLALPAGHDYRIVFMTRNAESIKASCERVDEYKAEKKYPIKTDDFHMPFDSFAPYNEDDMQHVIDICRQRRDMHIKVVNYDVVIKHPLEAFHALNSYMFPLDPEKAAAVINPELKRY